MDVQQNRFVTGLAPIFRLRAGRMLSPAEVADILEQHVGADRDAQRCVEARDALLGLRRAQPGFYLRAALRLIDEQTDPQACVARVIAILRKFSGSALR